MRTSVPFPSFDCWHNPWPWTVTLYLGRIQHIYFMLRAINKYNKTCLCLYNPSFYHPVQSPSGLTDHHHSVTHKLLPVHRLAPSWPPSTSYSQAAVHSTADLYEPTSRISSPSGSLFPLYMASPFSGVPVAELMYCSDSIPLSKRLSFSRTHRWLWVNGGGFICGWENTQMESAGVIENTSSLQQSGSLDLAHATQICLVWFFFPS